MSDIASAFAAGTEAALAAVDGRVGSMASPSGASDRGMRGGRSESATDHTPDGRPGLEQRSDAVGDRRAHHQEDEDDGDELLAVHAGSRILGQLGVSRRVGFVGQGRRTSFASAHWRCSLAVLGSQSTARPRRRESPGGVGRRSRARAPPRAPLAGIPVGHPARLGRRLPRRLRRQRRLAVRRRRVAGGRFPTAEWASSSRCSRRRRFGPSGSSRSSAPRRRSSAGPSCRWPGLPVYLA